MECEVIRTPTLKRVKILKERNSGKAGDRGLYFGFYGFLDFRPNFHLSFFLHEMSRIFFSFENAKQNLMIMCCTAF